MARHKGNRVFTELAAARVKELQTLIASLQQILSVMPGDEYAQQRLRSARPSLVHAKKRLQRFRAHARGGRR